MLSRINRRNRAKSLETQTISQAVACVTETLERRVLLSTGAAIFVTEYQTNQVGEFSSSGATVNAALATGLSDPQGIAISGSDVFVASETAGQADAGTIGEYSTSGATINATLITGVSSGLLHPVGLAIYGSDLYVVNFGGDSVGEYSLAGAPINTSLITGLSNPLGIAISGTNIFIQCDNGTIGKYTMSGATVNSDLISGVTEDGGGEDMVVSGSDLYAFVSLGKVNEYTTSGALVKADLISGLVGPSGMALSGSDLFISESNLNGTIGEYTTSGTTINSDLVSVPSSKGLDGIALIPPSPLAAPTVTTDPTSQSVDVGNAVTFTAAASGNPTPTVQWEVSSDNGRKYSDIAGATNTSYDFTPAADQNGDDYRAVFINSQSSATTSAATLTVISSSISGDVYNVHGGAGMAGVTVTLQPLKHGRAKGSASNTTTDSNGDYSFTGLAAATYSVSETLPSRYKLITPSSVSYTVGLSAGQGSTGNDFGDKKKRGRSDVAFAMRASTPFAITGNLASSAALQADAPGLLFGSQDKQDIFTD